MYKNNCLVFDYSENPADFPLVRQLLLNQVPNHATILIRNR